MTAKRNVQGIPKRAFVVLLGLAAVLLSPGNVRVALLPLVACAVTGAWFFLTTARKSQVAPVAEIGIWFMGAVTVYAVVPLAVYLAVGQQYTPVNDNRLLQIQPSPWMVAKTGWLYWAFMAAFGISYLAVRGRHEGQPPLATVISRQTLKVLIGFWVVLSALWYLAIPTLSSESYAGAYAAVAALPLGVRQLMKLWIGWGVILPLAVRVWLFQDFARKKWIIAVWLAYDAFIAFSALGSRTSLVLSLGSSALLYHYYVRPIPVRVAMTGAVAGVVGFMALGFFRALQAIGSLAQFVPGNAGGEFEALFGNAVDLQARVATGEVPGLPLSFHLADIIAAIPSQFLPFEKVDPALWYIRTFYPEFAELGHGFAFGVVAQSIVGFGWVELVIRGLVLGYVFGNLHRYFARNSHRFWVVVFYVWITVWSYQSFRDQSFILLSYTLQQFVPLVLIIELFRRIMPRAPVLVPDVSGTRSESPSPT